MPKRPHSMPDYSLHYSLQTFGAYASAEQIDQTLGVSDTVEKLPQGAHILNVGAGPYFGVTALIHTLRPDVTLTCLDPGYYTPEYFYNKTDTVPTDVQYIEQRTEKSLGHTQQPHYVAGVAEELPFANNTFDYIFGHASVPQNMAPNLVNQRLVIENLSRVAKVGARIDLGPHMTDFEYEWSLELKSAVDSKLFAQAKVVDKEVYIADYDMTVSAFATVIER